jgi:hypothetical protein
VREAKDINVEKKLSTDRIFGWQHNTCEDILVDLCRGSLGKPKVAKDFPHVVHLLAAMTSSNVLGFRGRKGRKVFR